MGFFDNLGKSIVNSAKSELQYELQHGVRQGVRSAISNGKKAMSKGWKCSCGATNDGKFCKNCGKERNAAVSTCKKCGWSSDDSNVKFCPNCGNNLESSAQAGSDVNLGNMSEHMKEVPEELEERIMAAEKMQPGQSGTEYLRNMLSVAKDTRNLTFENMSVLTKAMANTTRQAGGSSMADKIDELSDNSRDIARGKYDNK